MKTKYFGLRLSEDEKMALDKEASRNGLTLAAYIRHLSKLKVDLKMTIKELRGNDKNKEGK